jgi:hypothetical protein
MGIRKVKHTRVKSVLVYKMIRISFEKRLTVNCLKTDGRRDLNVHRIALRIAFLTRNKFSKKKKKRFIAILRKNT